MLGSYPPSGSTINKTSVPRIGWSDAPSGALSRGKYKGKHRFIDDDKECHLEYDYAFSIEKK